MHVRIGEIERIDPYGHVNVIPGERSSSPPLRTEVHARSRPGSNGPWRSAVRFKSSNGLPATVALQRETRTIPIVFASGADPVASGTVAALNQPGKNITGFATTEAALGGKWLELLSEIAPELKRAAIMFNPDFPGPPVYMPSLETAARSLKVALIMAPVHSDVEIEAAIMPFGREPGGGLVAMPDAFMFVHRAPIISGAARNNVRSPSPSLISRKPAGVIVRRVWIAVPPRTSVATCAIASRFKSR